MGSRQPPRVLHRSGASRIFYGSLGASGTHNRIRMIVAVRQTAADREITSTNEEVVFKIEADAKCSTGSHKNLFCAVDVQQNGQLIPHNIAQGGILRIVPPKKDDAKIAAAEKKK